MGSRANFRGKDQVLSAYELNEVGPWAICCGRDIMFQCTYPDPAAAGDMLDRVLTKLIEAGGQGDYQLRIYEELPGGKKITNATPFNYSFHFMLMSDDDYEARTGRPLATGQIGAVIERLQAIEEKLLERDQEGPPEPENKFQAAIGAMIERPEVQRFLLEKMMGLVNGVFSYFSPKPRTSMSGFQPEPMNPHQKTAQELFQALPEIERSKFDQAVYVLLAGDPNIGTNLMKLASILQTDPEKYNLLTQMA